MSDIIKAIKNNRLTFDHMEEFSTARLKELRKKMRNRLYREIQKQNQLKGEILFLQHKIKETQNG